MRQPSLHTLFISCFFLLALQAATLLAQTEGYLAHLVCSEGWWGGGGESSPAGAGLTAAFHSDGHERSIHYSYGGFRSHHRYSGAASVYLIQPFFRLFFFFSIGSNRCISIILKQPNMLASHIKKRGTGELPLFQLISYRQSLRVFPCCCAVTGKNLSFSLHKDEYEELERALLRPFLCLPHAAPMHAHSCGGTKNKLDSAGEESRCSSAACFHPHAQSHRATDASERESWQSCG